MEHNYQNEHVAHVAFRHSHRGSGSALDRLACANGAAEGDQHRQDAIGELTWIATDLRSRTCPTDQDRRDCCDEWREITGAIAEITAGLAHTSERA